MKPRTSSNTETYAVAVTKVPLAIQALDTAGTYGDDEPEYKWDLASNQPDYGCAGLVRWDTVENVYEENPTVELDTENVTGGKTFKELDASPNPYVGALKLTGGVSQNYDIHNVPGNLVVNPADLGDTTRFTASVKNTTYNTKEQTAQVKVVDNAFDPARTLEQDAQYKVTYLTNHTDAGTAYVLASGMGGNYTGRQLLDFEIDKATGAIVTQSAAKVYDGTALTAQGTISGVLDAGQHTFKTTGEQADPSVSRNTYDLTFQNQAKANNYGEQLCHRGELGTSRGRVERCEGLLRVGRGGLHLRRHRTQAGGHGEKPPAPGTRRRRGLHARLRG